MIRHLLDSDLEISANEYGDPTHRDMMTLVRGLDREWTLVVEVGGRPVGFAAARPEGCLLHLLHLLLLDIEPEMRRRGLGGGLVERLAVMGRDAGLNALVCEVWDGNAAGIAFYERNGFERGRRIRDYYPGGLDAVVMVRRMWRGVRAGPFPCPRSQVRSRRCHPRP